MGRIAIGIIAILVLLGVLIRASGLRSHFTHIDDLLVVSNVLEKNRVERIHYALTTGDTIGIADQRNSGLYCTMKDAYELGIFYPVVYQYFKVSSRFTQVSKLSTYAPLQCGIVTWLVPSDDAGGYDAIKFKGRLVSCFFGVASLFAFLWLANMFLSAGSNERYWLACFPLALLVFSWENIIYAQQMEPYTIVVFFHLLLLAILFRFAESTSWKYHVVIGIVLALFAWGHYQMIFAVAAFLLTQLVMNVRDLRSLIKIAAMGSIFLILAFPLWEFLSARSDGGINWNAGPDGKFCFSFHDHSNSLWELIWYTVAFFLENSYLVVRSQIGFMPSENSIWVNLITVLFLMSAVAGLFFLFLKRKENTFYRKVLWYLGFLSLIWIVLIVSGKITLSPTRHSMVHLPPLLLLSLVGLHGLYKKFSGMSMAVSASLATFVGILFLVSWQAGAATRRDPFSEMMMQKLLDDHRPALVVQYGFTDNYKLYSKEDSINLLTIHVLSSSNAEYNQIGLKKRMEAFPPTKILLVSARVPWNEHDTRHLAEITGLQVEKFTLKKVQEILSGQEVEYSSLTSNGTNQLFVYIMERKQ